MSDVKTIPTLDELLGRSSATAEFAAAAREFASSKQQSQRITFNAGSPPVKVLRAIMQLLDRHPDLPVESVAVDAVSGCSDFRGTMTVRAGGKSEKFRFTWDCAWRAEQEGWRTPWGEPDQQRAALAFGYQCFEVFEKM